VPKDDKIFRVKGDDEIITVAQDVTSRFGRARRESTAFSESLDALVDHGSDYANSDGDDRHADQDGPDPSNANGANHERDLNGSVVVPSISRLH
jgi:hypothetical protein